MLKLSLTTSQGVIRALKKTFSRHGIPDNGPQFGSKEFSDFAKLYDFCHVTSSPHYPQSNGLAEGGVKTIKRLLRDSEDLFMALLNLRTAPLPWCNLSQAELLMGRHLRCNLPMSRDQLVPKWPYLKEFARRDSLFKQRQKQHFDRRHRVAPLYFLFSMTVLFGLTLMVTVLLV